MDSAIAIEDEFEDVLGKAMRGQGFTVERLARELCCEAATIKSILGGEFKASVVRAMALKLGLNRDSVVALAEVQSGPAVQLPKGIRLYNTPYPMPGYKEMTVNSYSFTPTNTDRCFLIDAGVSADVFRKDISDESVHLEGLFLTHTHQDHVASYEALSQVAAQVYAPALEPYASAALVRDGDKFELGKNWQFCALATPGHSAGGTTYLLSGPDAQVAFVGDAIFCFSMGKADSAYNLALSAIREKILCLPGETILCPGHGPPTTVGFEKENNPFFSEGCP